MARADFTLGWMIHIDTVPDSKSRVWITSLVEYLNEGGMSIMRHGDPIPPQDVPINKALNLDEKQCFKL